MRHRAPETDRPDPIVVRAAGPVRIRGSYPPPLDPAVPGPSADLGPPASAVPAGFPTAEHPQVTRYGRPRRQPTAASRAWGATSVVLASAGVAAVLVLPPDPPAARLDSPVAVAAPVAPAAAPATITDTTPGTAPATITDTTPVVLPVPAVASPVALHVAPSTPSRVQIPALGITSSVIRLGLERDGSMEVPRGAYPVGWFDGGPTPGEVGPAVLAGHVDWAGEPGAFYGLRELERGDRIVVDRDDGSQLTFLVDRVEEHPKDTFPTDEVYGDIESAGLRLITCGGAFDEDTGDYRDNVVVFADLASTD